MGRLLILFVAVIEGVFILTGRPQSSDNGAAKSRFDVASVKRIAPGSPPPSSYRRPREHGTYTLPYTSLQACLETAFELMPYRISAPAWMETEHYQIRATMPPETPASQVLVMLQNLLVERFRIKFHWEDRQTAVYALIVDKNGPKLTQALDPNATPMFRPRGYSFTATNCTLSRLAGILMRWTGRPVVDTTGIEGEYDFKLDWSSREVQPTGPIAEGMAVPAMSISGSDPMAVLGALPSLGLKAVSRKIPLKFLVIDQAEKDPIEN